MLDWVFRNGLGSFANLVNQAVIHNPWATILRRLVLGYMMRWHRFHDRLVSGASP